jgi:hypothetical protein
MALARFASITDPEASVGYDGLDEIAPTLDDAAREALATRLREFTSVREDRDHPNYQPNLLARHHATLARLGDAESATRLLELARGRDGWAAYVAARHALELELEGSAGLAATVLSRGRVDVDRVGTDPREALLDAAVSALGESDGRWAVALLDGRIQRRAEHHLARHPQARGACQAVLDGMEADVSRHVIGDALRALSLLGDRCVPQLVDMVNRAPHPIRNPALKVLGMIRAPQLEALAARWIDDPRSRGAARAALDIARRPD